MGNAPENATVSAVVKGAGEPWDGNDGKMQTFEEVLFEGDGRTRKVYAPAGLEIAQGTVLKGWKNDQKGSFTVAVDKPQNGGERRSSTAGGKSYDRSPDHPVQMQRALHTSALSMAVPLIEQMFTFGLSDVPKPTTKDEYLKLVEGVATWVQGTYPKAVLDQAAKADAESA